MLAHPFVPMLMPFETAATVYGNVEHLPPGEQNYIAIGTALASIVGIKQISDAFSPHDALDAHEQSIAERVLDGVTGTVQLGTTAIIIYHGGKWTLPSPVPDAQAPPQWALPQDPPEHVGDGADDFLDWILEDDLPKPPIPDFAVPPKPVPDPKDVFNLGPPKGWANPGPGSQFDDASTWTPPGSTDDWIP